MGMAVDATNVVSEQDGAFEVWQENWETLLAWLAVETQWRVVETKTGLKYLGLDYSAVDVVLRRRQSLDHVFEDLQTMENAALAAFSKAAE